LSHPSAPLGRQPAHHGREAITVIADYIGGFYNSVRPHTNLGNLPPNVFEQQSQSSNLSRCPKKLDRNNPVNGMPPYAKR
jgi:hypothetical protein